MVLICDKNTGHIIRFSRSVRVLITVESYKYKLLEIARQYQDQIVYKTQSWSVSETRKIGEPSEEAAVRGLYEELRLCVKPDTLVKLHFLEISPHRSSVYNGLWSYSESDGFKLNLDKMPWKEPLRIVEDFGVKLHLKWVRG